LETTGARLHVVAGDIDETPEPGETPEGLVARLAAAKAEAVLTRSEVVEFCAANDATMVVAADTVVALDGEILGKPGDDATATAMLTALSGRGHLVHTGIAVTAVSPAGQHHTRVAVETTRVQFSTLGQQTIAGYVATGEPHDKAGAYGIQGRAGRFVTAIEGNYQNVVGLPLSTLDTLVEKLDQELSRPPHTGAH
jgi:septum formation protein